MGKGREERALSTLVYRALVVVETLKTYRYASERAVESDECSTKSCVHLFVRSVEVCFSYNARSISTPLNCMTQGDLTRGLT